jgi:multiple sugar transport system ATP-binding protein
MASVRLDGLVKRFDSPEGTIVANDDIDLTVEDGEFLVIVGPSGSGKSTALRCVAGLEDPSDGIIYIGDEDVTDLAPRERDLAMVFQNYALYPHKTVKGNMRYGLEKSGDLSTAEMDERVREFAEMMEIEETLEKRPDQLSGGQKQRVALGRAIVQEPEVFLMDEPLSNLDAKLRIQMRTEFQRLHNELGITTIYVTHDQEEAMTMGDRIVVMDGGEIQQVAEPADIYDRPANYFVAQFIGEITMNFADVTIEDGTVTSDEFGFQFSMDGDVEDGEYLLGIRPEDVELVAPESGTGTATVDVTEPTGSEAVVYLTDSRETRVAVDEESEFAVVVDRTNLPAEGSEIGFRIPPEKIHLFDPDTEEAVYHGRAKRTDAVTPTA